MKTILLIVGLLLGDQLTKYFFYDQGLLSEIFYPVLNTGAAWSLPVPVWIIFLLAIGLFVRLTYEYTRRNVPQWVYVLFVAGMLGNIIDRVWVGAVRDFIVVADRWPIFNLADVYLTLALFLWIYSEFTQKKTSSQTGNT